MAGPAGDFTPSRGRKRSRLPEGADVPNKKARTVDMVLEWRTRMLSPSRQLDAELQQHIQAAAPGPKLSSCEEPGAAPESAASSPVLSSTSDVTVLTVPFTLPASLVMPPAGGSFDRGCAPLNKQGMTLFLGGYGSIQPFTVNSDPEALARLSPEEAQTFVKRLAIAAREHRRLAEWADREEIAAALAPTTRDFVERPQADPADEARQAHIRALEEKLRVAKEEQARTLAEMNRYRGPTNLNASFIMLGDDEDMTSGNIPVIDKDFLTPVGNDEEEVVKTPEGNGSELPELPDTEEAPRQSNGLFTVNEESSEASETPATPSPAPAAPADNEPASLSAAQLSRSQQQAVGRAIRRRRAPSPPTASSTLRRSSRLNTDPSNANTSAPAQAQSQPQTPASALRRGGVVNRRTASTRRSRH